MYINGNNIFSMRSLGAIAALEELYGLPEYFVTTGTGTMISAYCSYLGTNAAQVFFEQNFNFLKRNLAMDMLGFLTAPSNARIRNYNLLNDFYTLFKVSTNKKNLGISEAQRLLYFIEDKFSFITSRKPIVKSYLSSFELENAQERLFQTTSSKLVKTSLAVVPFLPPVEINEKKYISTQSVQGVPSRTVADGCHHVLLDTVGKRGYFNSMTSFQVMISANEMMMLELKRRAMKNFDFVVDLREHFSESEGNFLSLYREGYNRTKKTVKKINLNG